MSEYRFDDRVAVVTGAGRGIGRAYARLLAAQGARVVVNDLGGAIDGGGADPEPATAVAAEIGPAAIANVDDVATPVGAQACIDAALATFGVVDIVINNAGIMQWAAMPDIDDASFARHLAVHVGGAFNTTRAAWPHMVERTYGRIVMTTSTGVLGLPNNTAYATAKGGIIGLARSLATAGARSNIKVNCIAPAAMTRMAGPGAGSPQMAPDLVAPMAAFLAHEHCPVTGEIYTAGFGRFARLFIAETAGYVSSAPSIDDVAAHWSKINDESSYTVPADLRAWSDVFTAHLDAGDSGAGGS